MSRFQSAGFRTSLTAIAAACLVVGCGGGDDVAVNSGNGGNGIVVKGVVAGSNLTPGSSTDPTIAAGYYQGAKVCIDTNDNGKCDETSVTTDAKGQFSVTLPAGTSASAIIADIGTTAINTASGKPVAARIALRASKDQVAEQASNGIVISPMSSEVQRMMEADNDTYQNEKAALAARLSTKTVPISADMVLSDLTKASGAAATALLTEANALGNRFTYATAKFDRGDKYPDALAVAGGDPELATVSGVTPATVTVPQDTRKPITFEQAQQAAFNVEGIPRYDSIFIVMLENKGTSTIVNSVFAPHINTYLKTGNQLTSYFATGNPSEPNYTALGGADDFGITDDSQWNCDATGANAPQDLPLPVGGSSTFTAACTQNAAVHNIVGKPNLFNAITAAGLTWRTYSESMNPGQDFRADSVADPAITAPDHVYPVGTAGGNTTVIGNASVLLPLPAGLYKTKHHPGMAYQNVRSAPEWKYSNRTLGGGQWDNVLKNSALYPVPANYDVDQFSTDLASGHVGNLNFVIPDQCDDMHSISVKSASGVAASDCSGVSSNSAPVNEAGDYIITRGDNAVDRIVKKIQASDLWNNPQKHVAIVLMFDEGGATQGFNSCCGWNPLKSDQGAAKDAAPLTVGKDGSVTRDQNVVDYFTGNRGHGESIFGILTNQTQAPKGVADSDAYSHFAFVRTLQDMFQLADPASDASYMNRSKYTEKFIAANIVNLPEYMNSADTHFDSVRPINHAFIAPASYAQKQATADTVGIAPQVGPDSNQFNVWSLKK